MAKNCQFLFEEQALQYQQSDMYYQILLQLNQAVKTVELWFDKAEAYAKQKNFDIQVLLDDRLAPDMKTLIFQVQRACDSLKGAAARLSGQQPPKHEDDEKTMEDVRARIRKTAAYVESFRESDFVAAAEQHVSLPFAPQGKNIGAKDYLLQMALPNVYFHVSMIYALLRHNGVDVGKMDFLGPLNWVDA